MTHSLSGDIKHMYNFICALLDNHNITMTRVYYTHEDRVVVVDYVHKYASSITEISSIDVVNIVLHCLKFGCC